jgi:hypothetical protein
MLDKKLCPACLGRLEQVKTSDIRHWKCHGEGCKWSKDKDDPGGQASAPDPGIIAVNEDQHSLRAPVVAAAAMPSPVVDSVGSPAQSDAKETAKAAPLSGPRIFNKDRSAAFLMVRIFISMVLSGMRPIEFTHDYQNDRKREQASAKRKSKNKSNVTCGKPAGGNRSTTRSHHTADMEVNTAEPMDSEVDAAAPEPMDSKVDAASPEPMEVDAASPEPMEVDAASPEPMEVDAAAPEPMEVDAAAPEPMEVDAAAPEPMEVDAAAPESSGILVSPDDPPVDHMDFDQPETSRSGNQSGTKKRQRALSTASDSSQAVGIGQQTLPPPIKRNRSFISGAAPPHSAAPDFEQEETNVPLPRAGRSKRRTASSRAHVSPKKGRR